MLTLFDEEKIMKNHIRSEREQAAIQNTIEMCQDFELSFSDAVQKLIAKFRLSEADAESAAAEYWKQ